MSITKYDKNSCNQPFACPPPPAQTHLCPTPDNITQYRADQLIKGVFINFILYHSTACIIKKASL